MEPEDTPLEKNNIYKPPIFGFYASFWGCNFTIIQSTIMFGETPRSIHKNPYLKEADTHDWAMYQNTGFLGIVSGKIEKTVSILGRKVYSYHPMGRIIIPARTLNVLGLFHYIHIPPGISSTEV